MNTFLAYYEDAAKAEAAATKRGWTRDNDESGSWHDFIEVEAVAVRTCKEFKTLAAATKWLLAEIAAVKSVYGQGTILERRKMVKRCKYCTCQGEQFVREWVVSDEVDSEEARESECYSD